MSRVAGRFILWSLAMSTAYVTVVNSQGRGGQTQPSPYIAPATQVVAWRMLNRLAKNEDWAREVVEELFLDEEVEAWAKSAEL